MNKALIIVDVQNDFCPGGNLPVPNGDKVVPEINKIIDQFDFVILTQDWHPIDHGSFAINHPGKKPFEMGKLNGKSQMLWPVHALQNTKGADFHIDLNIRDRHGNIWPKVIQKGIDPNVDSYSAFCDNDGKNSTELADYLKQMNVKSIVIAGLALNYCVMFTALDAVKEGFRTFVYLPGCRGIDPGQFDAIEKMEKAGIQMIEKISEMEN